MVSGTWTNCSICHPAGEIAAALIEAVKRNPPPKFYRSSLYESASDRRKRRNQDQPGGEQDE